MRLPSPLDSIKVKVLATVLVVSALVAGGAGTLLLHSGARTLDEAFEQRAGALARTLARNATFGVLTGSRGVLDELLLNLMREPGVRRVQVLDRDGTPLATAGVVGDLAGERLRTVDAPVLVDPERERRVDDEFAVFAEQEDPSQAAGGGSPEQIGGVRVTLSEASLQRALRRVRRDAVLWALALALAGGVLTWLILSAALAPMAGLVRAVQAIEHGELGRQVPERGDRELRTLAGALNRMSEALKQHRAELRRTYEELAAKERLATVGQLTAAVAHELRNPMGILLSSAQIVANPDRSDAQRAEAASYLLDEVRRMDRTLGSFLDFARPRPAVPEALDPVAVARRAVTAVSQHEVAAGVALDLDVAAAAEGSEAFFDPDRVHQALLNLLLNACQATHGGDRRKVRLHVELAVTESHSGALVLAVEDNGPGVPSGLQAKVLEPFYTTRADGMGLGLATVAQTASAHGGRLEVATSRWGGARFALHLPTAQPEAGPASRRSQPAPAPHPSTSAPERRDHA